MLTLREEEGEGVNRMGIKREEGIDKMTAQQMGSNPGVSPGEQLWMGSAKLRKGQQNLSFIFSVGVVMWNIVL